MASNSKYDRSKLKKDFFTSNFNNVKDFFIHHYGNHTDHFKKKSKGRTMEKRRMSKNAFEKAKEEIVEEIKEQIKEYYKPSIEELSEMHKAIVGLLRGELKIMINNAKEGKVNSMYKINNIREIVKTEKGEPTSVGKFEADGSLGSPIQVLVAPEVQALMNKKKKGK